MKHYWKIVDCEVCYKKIKSDNPLDEGVRFHWVEEEGCYMCDDCYAYYEGQSIEELREEIT